MRSPTQAKKDSSAPLRTATSGTLSKATSDAASLSWCDASEDAGCCLGEDGQSGREGRCQTGEEGRCQTGGGEERYAVELYGLRKTFPKRTLRGQEFVAVKGAWLGIKQGELKVRVSDIIHHILLASFTWQQNRSETRGEGLSIMQGEQQISRTGQSRLSAVACCFTKLQSPCSFSPTLLWFPFLWFCYFLTTWVSKGS